MANVDLVNPTATAIVAGGETVPAYSVLSNRAVVAANLLLLTDAGAVALVTSMTAAQRRMAAKVVRLGTNPSK